MSRNRAPNIGKAMQEASALRQAILDDLAHGDCQLTRALLAQMGSIEGIAHFVAGLQVIAQMPAKAPNVLDQTPGYPDMPERG